MTLSPQEKETIVEKPVKELFRDHIGQFRDHIGQFQDHIGQFRDHIGQFRDHIGQFLLFAVSFLGIF